MRALKLYGKRDLRYEEAEEPFIEKNDEVIIKVKAAGICGSDLSRYAKLGPYIEGMVWGHEFSGEVAAIGSGVHHVKIGDRVAACPALYCGKCESCKKGLLSQCEKLTVIGTRYPGAFAEYVKLPRENVLSIPETIDFDTATFIEPSAVVAHGFYRTRTQPGADVAVVGCGSIGLLAVQWAKIFGASKVYAIDIDNKKLDIAKEVGADVVIHAVEKTAYEQLMELTDGNGVDLVIESAGSPITSAQVFALAKKGGEVLFLGIPYSDVNIERFYFEKIVRNELTVLGSWNAISAPFPGREWSTTIECMSKGLINVRPLITHRVPLSQGPEIFERITNKNGFFGKVLFYPEIQ
ncbi:galactitol-1-phosphate 5-dehydrogenase [Symbiobacterium thermophilum]|uniref:Galactitol-1-phosphate 5-dehydrogenase n=1 Tax=Symbiobacterium thermophilum TaxID=2734 RepID=A0A953IAD3_SYMTR|nr:galactitol-1-phosphate 5-dehydrogenase [Symbiobacterium thermophilum]MBY6277383.1 galactitol-1-phosphate 5-dehydrogenase [Symbiobacterium thermophilum]